MSTETAVDPRIAKSNDALRTPMGEFWRKFKKQPVAMAAAGFVFFLIIVAIVGPMITPFDPENFFDYDRLNEGPWPCIGLALTPSGATSSAASSPAPASRSSAAFRPFLPVLSSARFSA